MNRIGSHCIQQPAIEIADLCGENCMRNSQYYRCSYNLL